MHRFEDPAFGIMVVTIVAVLEANLTILSISELSSPFVSWFTIDLMSPEKSSKAGSDYWMVLSFESQWLTLLLRSRASITCVTALEEWVVTCLRLSTEF